MKYANPYLAGTALGLVLLTTFVVTGHGLGAMGAFNAVASDTGPDLSSWIVIEVVGLMLGAAISARLAGRWGPENRTPKTANRLLFALAGGFVMAFGARLARGCTSGLGLTGGAAMSVGAWAFLMALFIGGYAAAPLLRRAWR